jgi:hypothetical protein
MAFTQNMAASHVVDGEKRGCEDDRGGKAIHLTEGRKYITMMRLRKIRRQLEELEERNLT